MPHQLIIQGHRTLAVLLMAIFLVPAAVSAQTGYGGGGGGGGFITPIAGDTNGDRRVNVLDFNALLAAWGRTGGGLASDMNRDGKIDIFDFNILLANWDR